MIPWTQSPAINGGQAKNQLRVVRESTNIALYANGQLLDAISDSTFVGTLGVGLTASAYDMPNVDARFDNFVVYPVPGVSGVPAVEGLAGKARIDTGPAAE